MDNPKKFEKTLYARGSTDNILVWNVEVIDMPEEHMAKVIIRYGQLFGRKASGISNITEGKNAGKSNETTYLQQAIKIAKSKVEEKLKEGYVENQSKLSKSRMDIDGDPKPMLAVKFEAGKVDYPAIVQPKINGLRCTARLYTSSQGLFPDVVKVKLKSRGGEVYNIPHIEEELINLFESIDIDEELILDGELFIPDTPLGKILSGAEGNTLLQPKLKYYVFDIISNKPQTERLDVVGLIFYTNEFKHIIEVPYAKIYSDIEALAFMENYISQGHEGAMIRHPDKPYQIGKRNKALIKVKKVYKEAFEIVQIVDSGRDNYRGNPIATFVCKNNKNDLTFKVIPIASKAKREEIYNNSNEYIGRIVTVFFRERTEKGLPFHANAKI